MEKNKTKIKNSSLERKMVLILSAIFLVAVLGGWVYALQLRKAIVAKNALASSDVQALVNIEKMRSLAESQVSNGLNFFLMGSSTIFDEQKRQKQDLTVDLAKFEKQYSLAQIPELIKKIDAIRLQEQDFFDQAMDFRAKQTDSKIVGQFFRSKVMPLKASVNKIFDEMIVLYKAEFERSQTQAQQAASDTELQIPKGMTWFTAVLSFLFFSVASIVLRMLKQRNHHVAERTRLFEAAKYSVHARDGILAAVSQELTEPLAEILDTTGIMKRLPEASHLVDGIQLIETTAHTVENRIKDILDQSKADTGNMTLRVDQIGLDAILEDARLMMQPVAKQKDIRLEFNPVNPPVLAFLDRERVLRVLSNIVGNAIKFSPKHSKVIVKVRSDQQFVFVSVTDSGPGIPEKHLAQLFDSFWQARKTADQGPGIGLGVVKTIIEAQGGVVTVESHVGFGSTFTFSLPRRRPVGANISKPASAPIRYNALPRKEHSTEGRL